jgi:hypothetical protein
MNTYFMNEFQSVTRGGQSLEGITKVVSAPLSHTPGSLYLARYAAKCTVENNDKYTPYVDE